MSRDAPDFLRGVKRTLFSRSALVVVFFGFAFSGLAARLTFLHLGPNEHLRARVAGIRHVEEPILVGRGRILDRSGGILGMDLTVYDVSADPQVIQQKGQTSFYAGHLARLLGLPQDEVLEKLRRSNRRQVYIRRYVYEEDLQPLKALKLPECWFEPISRRHYPNNALMCHVVGFSNAEGVGGAGVEQYFDRYLRGVPGVRVSEQDGRGRELLDRRVLEIPPQAGSDVMLTLDANLQHMVEEALDRALETTRAKGVWAVLQRVRTGEILAMASRPAYDLNTYSRVSAEDQMNRCITHIFEPGSTFKAAVVAAALNEGIVTPDTVFDCENGSWRYNGSVLRDYHPYGRLTVADVLKKSSNIGTAKIAIQLGDERLERYLREFGIGQITGIELPGEQAGIFRPRSRWSKVSISRIPIGHEVGVTALQMMNVYCTIANEGFRLRPGIVRRIVDAQGRIVLAPEPDVLAQPIRQDTARLMCRLLARVTEEGGTGRKAALEHYVVAGKTGTAQKLENGVYSNKRNVASFVGFLPAGDPQIGLIVVVDEPDPTGESRTGGQVAAPVFKEIAREAVRYLDIPPADALEIIDPGQEEPVPEEFIPSSDALLAGPGA